MNFREVNNFLKKCCPHLFYFLDRFNRNRVRSKSINFAGWGLETVSVPPWKDTSYPINRLYEEVHHSLVSKVRSGSFKLSQFETVENGLFRLDDLKWRHYFVFCSAIYATKSWGGMRSSFVECGVCDGLTAYFALGAIDKNAIPNFSFYLYDSWGGMRDYDLVGQEKKNAGKYDYLDQSVAEDNLLDFREFLVFNEGYIPDSFQVGRNPDSLSWLHIDLNATVPTFEALKFFYDKIVRGGIILFDDYGSPVYQETRKCVDDFLGSKNGIIFHLPTRQALFFKT